MNYRLISILVLLVLTAFVNVDTIDRGQNKPSEKMYASNEKPNADLAIEHLFESLNTNHYNAPKLASFKKAITGFYELKQKGLIKKDILTLIDFSMSSNSKRLWVIDLKNNTILYNSLVAHGKNTGEEFANSFSNASESNKSSLGFYVTGEIYHGKHGMSLRLDGLEKGVNDNARARGVVMHAADYVSQGFVKIHKRLGRSQGCPAIPDELTKEIVTTIKDKSCLFIYHPSRDAKLLTKLVS
jgi:hypothetical protein